MKKNSEKVLNIALYIIMFFYLIILLDLLFRFSAILDPNREVSRSFNFIPFKTIGGYLANEGGLATARIVQNLLGNVLVFAPLGLYIQTLMRKNSFLKSLLIVAASSAAAELLQFAFGLGACDIDDLILNTLGGALGILLYMLIRRAFHSDDKAKKAVAVLSLIIGLPIILVFFGMGIRFRS